MTLRLKNKDLHPPLDFWEPDHGTNRIRFIPFAHEIKGRDFALGRYADGSVRAGDVVQELWVVDRWHFNPVVRCTKMERPDGTPFGNCEVCDNYHANKVRDAEFRDRGWHKMAPRSFRVCWLWTTAGLQLARLRPVVCRQLEELASGKGPLANKTVLGVNGRDFDLRFNSTAMGASRYKLFAYDSDDSKALTKVPEPSDLMNDPYFVPAWAWELFGYKPPEAPDFEMKKRPRKKEAPPSLEPSIGLAVLFDVDGQPVTGRITGEPNKDGEWLVTSDDGEGFRVTADALRR